MIIHDDSSLDVESIQSLGQMICSEGIFIASK